MQLCQPTLPDFQVGQLMHLRSFTLFDAMSAIEVMDPKMDTGMAIGDSTPFDVKQPLDAKQTLWIMDRLLSCEVSQVLFYQCSLTDYARFIHRWDGCLDIRWLKRCILASIFITFTPLLPKKVGQML